FPILCPGRAALLRIPLDQPPSLHPLRRCLRRCFVRGLPRYYAAVRPFIIGVRLLTARQGRQLYLSLWATMGSPGFRALCFCTCLGSSTARSLLRTRLTALSSLAFEY